MSDIQETSRVVTDVQSEDHASLVSGPNFEVGGVGGFGQSSSIPPPSVVQMIGRC